jgi:hypothetical protein
MTVTRRHLIVGYGIATAAIASAGLPQAALAADCSAEIRSLSQRYALSPDQKSDTPRDLSQSNGVIVPKEEPPSRVIEPSTKDAMPTTPAIPQQTEQGTVKSDKADAAQRMQIQALLEAARQAQAEGNDAKCLDDVSRARALQSGEHS